MVDPIVGGNETSTQPRFGFGDNWTKFASKIDGSRIDRAEQALLTPLARNSLEGLQFLDVGSGSGLSSLAAARLGATVRAFDYDKDSVSCTTAVLSQHLPSDVLARTQVSQGDVLDKPFLEGLGTFDIVYSWGVLHHTGSMWTAIENVLPNVKPGGHLFLALYNDQGRISQFWRTIKRTYNALPPALHGPFTVTVMLPLTLRGLVWRTLVGDAGNALKELKGYQSNRGMSLFRDWVDWVGGYPFEVARPGDVVNRITKAGFKLKFLKTVGGALGCNEFVFVRDDVLS